MTTATGSSNMTHFLPDPIRINGRKFQRRGAIRAFINELAGEPAPEPQPDDEFLMSNADVKAALGGVSDDWIIRHTRPTDEEGAAA